MRFPERLGNGVMLKFLRGLVEGVAYVTPPFSTVFSEGDKRVDVSAATATPGDGTCSYNWKGAEILERMNYESKWKFYFCQ